MTKSIRTHLTEATTAKVRETIAHELAQLIGDYPRTYIQEATAAAGHKVTTAKLRKLLAGEADATILDVLAIAHALQANALPGIVRAVTAATIETTKEEK